MMFIYIHPVWCIGVTVLRRADFRQNKSGVDKYRGKK